MAYSKKTWLARLGQGLNKFIFNGGSKVTLDSSPDLVTQEGTPLSAENMNDLEQRIDDEFTNVNEAIASLVAGLVKTTTVTLNVPLTGSGYISYTLPVDGARIISIFPETGKISNNNGLQLTPCNQKGTAGQLAYMWYNRPQTGIDTDIPCTINYI